jgi:hypothetical protein
MEGANMAKYLMLILVFICCCKNNSKTVQAKVIEDILDIKYDLKYKGFVGLLKHDSVCFKGLELIKVMETGLGVYRYYTFKNEQLKPSSKVVYGNSLDENCFIPSPLLFEDNSKEIIAGKSLKVLSKKECVLNNALYAIWITQRNENIGYLLLTSKVKKCKRKVKLKHEIDLSFLKEHNPIQDIRIIEYGNKQFLALWYYDIVPDGRLPSFVLWEVISKH